MNLQQKKYVNGIQSYIETLFQKDIYKLIQNQLDLVLKLELKLIVLMLQTM